MQSIANDLTQRWLGHSVKWLTYAWMFAVVFVLVWGWTNREQDYLSAENGLGYLLGIVGSSMMLLLLTYSLRKRLKVLRRWLSVKFWFRLHMTFGIVGPLCILFHSNFHLGSLNSTVSLVCMLLVAGSGVAGRYLYTRIHYGLYGEKIRLQQVSDDFRRLHNDLAKLAATPKQKAFVEKLFNSADTLVATSKNSNSVFSLSSHRKKFKQLSLAFKKFISQLETYYQNKDEFSTDFQTIRENLHKETEILMSAFRKLPGLQLSEKLFSLWHIVHIPIFILMIFTAVTHIVVVHMY